MACDSIAACPGQIGEVEDAAYASLEECVVDCSARGLLDGEYPAGLNACLGQVMCDGDGIAGCLEGRPPVDCSAGWDAIMACNNNLFVGLLLMVNDRAGFVALCEQSAQANAVAVEEGLDCLDRSAQNAGGNPLACFEQLACVGPFQ
jgi:hypothetical protein